MDIALTSDLEQLIAERMQTGRYHSPSEVVAEALHLLREHDRAREQKLADLRKEIAVGVEQAERGELLDFDADEFKRRVLGSLAADGERPGASAT
jgi:antitoxin ParD1/3/4